MYKKIILAFSGGLDTSFCVPYLKEKYGAEIITVTVDTGGFSDEELAGFFAKSRALDASAHFNIDARQKLYDNYVAYVIKANALRGGVYPLCVAAERAVQAEEIVNKAFELGADAVAHGSTGAGNDQVRFDVAFGALGGGLAILAPIRDLGWTRAQETEFLEAHGHEVKTETKEYSINAGLWGTTIGGKETHDSWDYPPEKVFTATASIADAPEEPETITIGFENGMPVSLDGEKLGGLDIVAQLAKTGGLHGVGRGVHLGDTILGLKGRIVFEAPAPLILIEAHHELEKLVLTKEQLFWKHDVDHVYADRLHHGLYFEPLMRDLEAFIDSSQKTVTGEVKVVLHKGNIFVTGVRSPYSMMNKDIAAYGETSVLWDGRDAAGFAKIFGLPTILAGKAGKKAAE